MAYNLHNLHCFGFVVNLDPDQYRKTGTAMWGVTDVYDMMQKCSDDVIARQIMNWESMMRSVYLKLKGEPEGLPGPIYPNLKKKDTEINRDFERRIFRESLRGDMIQILQARGTLSNPDSVKVPWVNWANCAYDKKFCIIHYPISARKPGPGFDISNPACMAQKDIDDSNTNRRHDTGGFVRIISWTHEDMELELHNPQLADVVLCMNSNARPVLTAADS
ncbi:hypothetical protein H0H92_009096, partial [Tricholoma furcatifolium]